jgi:hypothetical protein
MPLIVISGLPCSGKSTVAGALADLCRQRGQEVQIVDEESLHLQRNDSYKGGPRSAAAAAAACPRLPQPFTPSCLLLHEAELAPTSHGNKKRPARHLSCCCRRGE